MPEAEARSVSCTPYLDAVVACHSPLWQVAELYRQGTVDDCKAKWTQLFDCAALRAKPDPEALVRRPPLCFLVRPGPGQCAWRSARTKHCRCV